MSSHAGKSEGFTLLEVLLATAMTAVLLGSLYASLHAAFKARDSAAAATDPARRMELTMALLERDFASAVVPKGILAGEFLGQDANASSTGYDDLVFHRTAPAGSSREGVGDIEKVELSCEAAQTGSELVLMRRVTTNLLSNRTVDPQEEVLCRGIRAFNLRYFDGSDWQDEWDATAHDSALPLAIEVTVELDVDRPTRQGDLYRLSRVVLIPCGALPADTTVVLGL